MTMNTMLVTTTMKNGEVTMSDRMTIDEAVRWLLDKNNRKHWNVGEKKMLPQNLLTMENRLNSGEMKELAKLNLIERSGMFDKVMYFELKDTKHP